MMKPANNPNTDYKALVREGYNQCAHAYTTSRMEEVHPELFLLIEELTCDAKILDIGCGGGIPVCQELVKYGSVIGIDISPGMIARARQNVPNAKFFCNDIMGVEFPACSFDAITSFYAVFHLPKEEHEELFRRIHRWLKPKGFLMATVAATDELPYTEDDFFGVTMYWSNYGISQYIEMLTRLGFVILEDTRVGHGFKNCVMETIEIHPLIFAQKR